MKNCFQIFGINIISAFSLMLITAWAGCSNRSDGTESFNKETVSAEVKSMLNSYHQDIKDGGLTAEFKYLDSSSDFFWVPPGYSTVLTYDSVRTILENNSKAFSSIEFHWDTLQIFPLSNEIASYTGIVGGVMTDTAGLKTQTRIIESGVVIKRDDGWKLLCGQSAALE